MPETQHLTYPKYLNTKDDYLFAVKNFPRDFWYDDVMNLYADGLTQIIVGEFDGDPNLDDKPDDHIIFYNEAKSKAMSYLYTGKEYKTILANSKYEYRKYVGNNTCIVSQYTTDPDSKMAKLGFTNEELESILFNESIVDDFIEKIKEENEELTKTIKEVE